ncbi:hypothetical protein SBOR_9286 [Sclerotinia borealis F-4128]|uniref:Uncharacterized protein n=1 Tax=Sclerotinia borealis (strain F-4128) TaxID=1432307 RepID=W9C710_SCLBF|nr:hypothetical protein SBOR_9286 [Sclerotinia borealis F-4128]
MDSGENARSQKSLQASPLSRQPTRKPRKVQTKTTEDVQNKTMENVQNKTMEDIQSMTTEDEHEALLKKTREVERKADIEQREAEEAALPDLSEPTNRDPKELYFPNTQEYYYTLKDYQSRCEQESRKTKSRKTKRYKNKVPLVSKFCVPAEIIVKIFKNLLEVPNGSDPDLCTSVCFALTCRSNWAIFRQIHIYKVPLASRYPQETVFPDRDAICLGKLLFLWMYPKYRPIRFYEQHLIGTRLEIQDCPDILYLDIRKYPVGGEKEKRLAQRMHEYKANRFSKFIAEYKKRNGARLSASSDSLDWRIPDPYNMGEEWYPATVRILKHGVFGWPDDCAGDAGTEWLNPTQYMWYYWVWQKYKKWMLRDWVEQPEALEYKKLHGLGRGGEKQISMIHGLQMLRLVDVRLDQPELQGQNGSELNIEAGRGQSDEVKVEEKVEGIDVTGRDKSDEAKVEVKADDIDIKG